MWSVGGGFVLRLLVGGRFFHSHWSVVDGSFGRWSVIFLGKWSVVDGRWSVVLYYASCKPRLHVRHFYFTGKTLLSDVAGIVRPECCMRVARGRFCNKTAGQVWQNIPGYTCNRLQLLSQNSFEDDDLSVQVKTAHV